MKNAFLHVAGFSFIGLALLFLFSCSSPKATEVMPQNNTLGPLTTIGLFPITYEKDYPPPMPSDVEGMDLSKMITRHVEKVLSNKGYAVKKVDFPTELDKDAPFVSLEITPTALAANCPPELDGLLQIHVTFYGGISENDRNSFVDSVSPISLDATARLIDRKGLKEVWRNKGKAEPFNSGEFSNRLNFATYSLAGSLFETLPSK